MHGDAGNDALDGGSGVDTADYSTATSAVSVSLTWEIASGDGLASLIGIEHVIGSVFNDELYGRNDVNDRLEGGHGDDQLYGFGGDDFLIGGDGNDRLVTGRGGDTATGGAGSDTFVVQAAFFDSGSTAITDFNAIEDRIELEAGMAGQSTLAVLRVGSSAASANDRVIYDNQSGELFYDPDGNGSVEQTQIGNIGAGQTLTDLNFILI